MKVLTAQQKTKEAATNFFSFCGIHSFNVAMIPIKYVGVLLKCTLLIAFRDL
jgi:hypothetical protein